MRNYAGTSETNEMNKEKNTHPTAHCTNSSFSEKRNKYQSVFLRYSSRREIATVYAMWEREGRKLYVPAFKQSKHACFV